MDDTMRNAPRNAALRQDLLAWHGDEAEAALDKAIESELSDPAAKSSGNALPGQDILQRYSTDPVARPAIIRALLADPSVKNWINQAAQNVAKPYQGADAASIAEEPERARDAAQRLQASIAGLPPELAAAVTQASLPTIEDIAKVKLPAGEAAFETLQDVLSSIGDGPQAQSIIDEVAGYYTKDYGAVNVLAGHDGSQGVLAQSIVDAANGNGGKIDMRFARSLADQLDGSSSNKLRDMAQPIRNAAADGLQNYLASGKSPLGAYNRAQEKAAETTAHLRDLLKQAGALTPEQQQNFIKAYMSAPANADVYKNEAQAAKNLADYMNANRDNLIYAAGQTQDSAKQLYECLKDLTYTGQGTTALSFIGSINNDPAASKALGALPGYTGNFLDDTIASAEGELLVEKNGDSASAADALLQLAEPIFKEARGWNNLKKSFKAASEIKGDANASDVEKLSDGIKQMGNGRRGFAIASILGRSVSGASADGIKSMEGALGNAGVATDELSAGALRFSADAATFGSYIRNSAVGSSVSKFMPGVGVIMNARAAWGDANKAVSDPLYAGAVVGDVIALVGSGLSAFLPTEVLGQALTGLGAVISAPLEWIGGAIDSSKKESALKAETKKYLLQADDMTVADERKNQGRLDRTRMPDQTDGLDDKTIDALVNSDPDQIKALESLNMSPSEIQTLGEAHPELLQTSSKSDFLVDLAKIGGTQGAEVTGLADAYEKDNPRIAGILADRPSGAPLTSDDKNQFLHLISQNYPNTKAYLQVIDPDLVSPEADARRKADADFEAQLEAQGPFSDQQIGGLLKHNSDAAYQAEFISRLQQSQDLDRWVRSISQDDNGLPEAAKSAIQAAAKAGVFSSPDEANKYLNELP
ncbi:hypothetical protein [Trinickia dabaoshanensis]|uniref:hypothetical protein n=1 Tax=Trinickia dabaoshanensis TaxID=564714 RepID=UPI0013049618|nr:hypothetical protein [Trinickia dabaoshanensis]